MTTLVVFFAAMWLIVLLAPATPIGRALSDWLVVRPAARLSRIGRGHVLLTLAIFTGAAVLVWAVGHESVRLMAMALPDAVAWVTMFEVTAYLDALAVIVTAASATRITGLATWIRGSRARRPVARARRRTRRTPRPAAANDDDDGAVGQAA